MRSTEESNTSYSKTTEEVTTQPVVLTQQLIFPGGTIKLIHEMAKMGSTWFDPTADGSLADATKEDTKLDAQIQRVSVLETPAGQSGRDESDESNVTSHALDMMIDHLVGEFALCLCERYCF
jgi:hypothetical protein